MKHFNFKPGVMNASDMHNLFSLAKENIFSLPAINCIDTNSVNSVLFASKKKRTISIIQFSFSSSIFFGGFFYKKNIIKSAVYGSILAANYINDAAKYYNIPVILHTDHCNKQNLPWIDGLLNHYNYIGKSLFTSHMIDLSNYNLVENIDICSLYLKKFSKFNINLEIELGCTGGEEDGLDNTNINHSKLYTSPVDVFYAYKKLIKISKFFTIAASFGNIHGVYNKSNIEMKPLILYESQKLIKEKLNISNNKLLSFVFHGGSGTKESIIKESIKYGIVKINLDTDIQWRSWEGILKYYLNNKYYLLSQIGNPKDKNKPNKKFYDPRSWLFFSRENVINYLFYIFNILNCNNLY